MANVSEGLLPFLLPIVSAALLISTSVSCCLYRRATRNFNNLSERVATLEARSLAAPPSAPVPATPAIIPVYNLPYGAGANYRPVVQPYYPPSGIVASAPPMDMVPQQARTMKL